jgi:simple sugar transport system substrate-binding protein
MTKRWSLVLFNLLVLAALILSACQAEPTPVPTTAAPAVEKPVAAEPTTAPAEAEPAAAPAEGETAAPEAVVEEPVTGACTIPVAFTDPAKKPRIALVREVGEGGFMERYLAGAQSMADALGVELLESNARNDAAKMVQNIETAIQQKVDAIIVDHGRGDALQPAIQQALDAGIKVITFDLVVDDPRVSEIEQDDMQIGYTLSKKMAIDNAGNANVIYINVGGFAPLVKRDLAYQSVKTRFQGLNEVAQIGNVTDNTAADTQTRMEAALKENPDANVAIAMWDEFAKGAVRAIQQSGVADKVKVYSVDITNEDIGMMTEEGSPWTATVATDSYNVGRLAVRSAAALIGGEDLDKYLLVQPALITQEFLKTNNITNMDELVAALPELGESPLNWFCWMPELLAQNGASVPAVAASAGGGAPAVDFCATASPASAPEAFASPDKKVRIALVREVGEGGFMERYLAGAQSMADELGIELFESNARNDAVKMVQNIETAIQQQVDAIIVDHGRGDALQPAIQQALDAGIKVITFDLVVDDSRVPEIEQDDMQIGYTLSKKLAIDNAGNADVIYINVGGFAPLVKRDRAWQDTKVRYPGLNEVAQIGNVTDNTAADTQTRMEAAIKENPNANAAIAMWDEFAKGAVRAVQQSGVADKIKVYSVDITNEDIAMMTEEGSPWVATVATDSYNVGRLAVRAAAALVGGENVEKYLMVQPQLITQEFLKANNITSMDELVAALPALGESALAWYDWMCSLKP